MARRRLLDDAGWSEFLALPTEDQDLMRHCTLGRDDLADLAGLRTNHNRLGRALLMCAMRHPGRVLGPDETPPEAMVTYVARQLGVDPGVFSAFRHRDQTRREQIADLMQLHGYRSLDRMEARSLGLWLTPTAQVEPRPSVLIRALVGEMRRRRVLLPGPRVVELIVHGARSAADRITQGALVRGLPSDILMALDDLVVACSDGTSSRLAALRGVSVSPAARNLVVLVDCLQTVRALGIDRSRATAVPTRAFDRLADQGLRMTVQHLRDLVPPRRRATLVATMIRLEESLTDAALAMFDKLMGSLARKADRRMQDRTAEALRGARGHFQVLARAGRAIATAHEADADLHGAVDATVGWGRFLRAVAEAEDLFGPNGCDARADLVGRWSPIRRFAPAVLDTFRFEGGPGMRLLLDAVTLLKTRLQSSRRSVRADLPTNVVRRGWRPFMRDQHGTLDPRAWEVCVLFELRDRLRAGDIWVEGSRRFRGAAALLLPKASFALLRAEGPLGLGVPESAGDYLDDRRNRLRSGLTDLSEHATAGTLEDVVIENGVPKVSPVKAMDRTEAERIEHVVYDLAPRIKITDLLAEVDIWTGFSACFTHQRTGRAAEDRIALLTTILADGINLGLTRMAEACRGASLRQLAWVRDWHVREEGYAEALARIIDAHRALPLARLWGDGTTASSDGQFYQAGGTGRAFGDINARHGKEPGVAFYTHVSDQFDPFHSKVIAATGSEALHVLDGLLEHETGLRIERHHTDTGGATDHVFGLMALLGFRFAPRLRNLKDRRLYTLPGLTPPATLHGLVDGTIGPDLIRRNWDDLLRLAISVRSGHVCASAILERLAAYPRQNDLARALREIGRLERTLFTLDWLRDPNLRRQAQSGLNKGEARNALARAVFLHRLGEIRDRTFENQVYRASGLNLIVAAIILWNTRYLQQALDELDRIGKPIPTGRIRHIAPLAWEHIGLTGDYVWTDERQPKPGALRPPRRPPSLLAS